MRRGVGREKREGADGKEEGLQMARGRVRERERREGREKIFKIVIAD